MHEDMQYVLWLNFNTCSAINASAILQDCLKRSKKRKKECWLILANLVSDISCFVELPWCMELPTKGKDLGLYEAASVQLSSDTLNVVNQQQHTFKPAGKGIRRALLLHCKDAEQGDSLEGQRRERDLGKCQKWDTYTDTSHWIWAINR